MWGVLSDDRHGSVVYNCCWPSPAQWFSGPSPMGLATIFYCLRFETSLSVASYDSLGYGGGIRPRLHAGFVWRISRCSLYRLARIHWNQCKLFVVTKTCLLKRRLLSNRGSTLDCVTSRKCLPKRCLAMYCSILLSRKRVFTLRCLAMDYSVTLQFSNIRNAYQCQYCTRRYSKMLSPMSENSVLSLCADKDNPHCSVASILGCKTGSMSRSITKIKHTE
jgi:hypothetical protein